ncbi:Metal ABC transporter ATP-binding protein [Candidatus Bealeia paramacronuclearis]|uniref:Metal ABC transporter ATP-binding protein n=1 Tax=Candidatus Bealeia paramacronuclearis TaxID=1921001 RepID=A0ABZ2C6I3_9PROT|nr:Metal ABC transporter ATP-binding protein [Candidatus Bealeia paramacronuclearis]
MGRLDPPSITLQNLSVQYGHKTIIHALSGEFKPGSLTAIVGPNGGGKSTLLKAILKLIPNVTGEIKFQHAIPQEVAYLAQQNLIDRQFPLTVSDTVALGLFRKLGLFARVSEDDKKAIQNALVRVGLEGYENSPLEALSGGQFQRVLFARLILQNSPIIFLDEPFNAIDMRTIEDLMDIVNEWRQEGRLIVVVLHDIDLVRDFFPETLLLARNLIGWGKTEDILTQDRLIEAMHTSRTWDGEGIHHHG